MSVDLFSLAIGAGLTAASYLAGYFLGRMSKRGQR